MVAIINPFVTTREQLGQLGRSCGGDGGTIPDLVMKLRWVWEHSEQSVKYTAQPKYANCDGGEADSVDTS